MKRRPKVGTRDNSFPMPMMGSCIYLATGQSTLATNARWCCAVISDVPLTPVVVATIALTELSQQPLPAKEVLTVADRAGYYILVQMPQPEHRDVWVPTTMVLYERGTHALAEELRASFRHRYGKPMRKVPFYFREGKLPCPEPPAKKPKIKATEVKPKTGTRPNHNV